MLHTYVRLTQQAPEVHIHDAMSCVVVIFRAPHRHAFRLHAHWLAVSCCSASVLLLHANNNFSSKVGVLGSRSGRLIRVSRTSNCLDVSGRGVWGGAQLLFHFPGCQWCHPRPVLPWELAK